METKVQVPAQAERRPPLGPQQTLEPFFRVRLINIDHVLTFPGPLDRTECPFNAEGQPLRKVPVLRIFGATPAGQRVCMHVHNVYPYCFIRYKASLEPDFVLRYIHRLGRELNAALAASLRRNPDDPESNQFIAAIHLCKGTDFYGYHVGYQYFLKISFIDPSVSYRLAAVLESGGVMRTPFQPFEIHIRYQLQFMLDYNIFGCDFIDLDDCQFRQPIPEGDDVASDDQVALSPQQKIWSRNTVPSNKIQNEDVYRASHCELEMDVNAPWIMNRRKLKARDLHHDFDEDLARVIDANEKLVPSLRGLWEDERKRRAAAGLPPSVPAPDSAGEARHYKPGESPAWMSEERMRALLAKRIADDKAKTVGRERRPEHFTKRPGLDEYIMTTFEAVEVFHPYVEKDPYRDEYTQRSGPHPSAKVFDLNYSMTQARTFQPEQEGNAGDSAGANIDPSFFQSQGFLSQVQEAKAADTMYQDALSDHGEGEAEAEPEEPGDQEEDTTESKSRPFSRTTSSSSAQSSLFSSPRSSPRKATKLAPVSVPIQDAKESVDSSGSMSRPSLEQHLQTWMEATRKSDRSQSKSTSSSSSKAAKSSRVRFASVDLDKQLEKEQAPTSSDKVNGEPSSDPSNFSVSTDRSSQTVSASNASASRSRIFAFHEPAPSRKAVTESFGHFDLVRQVHKDPFFSDPKDVPEHGREYAGRLFKFQSETISYLKPFQHWYASGPPSDPAFKTPRRRNWQYGPPPPSLLEVQLWRHDEKVLTEQQSYRRRQRLLSQIEGATPANRFGFRVSQHEPTSLVPREKQHMTILAVEVLCCSRGSLFPDPAKDAVDAIAYSFQNEDETLQDTGSRPDLRTGIILRQSDDLPVEKLGLNHLAIEVVEEELELFNALIDLVRAFDPEILVGWEIHSSSWGYLVERAMKEFDIDLVPELGRVLVHNTGRAGGKSDNYAYTQSSALKITGRHVLNTWRLMKGELTLNMYSLENVCYHLLHRRVPKFSYESLTTWFRSGRATMIARALQYYVDMAELVLEILQESEFVFRTAEFARIYGIDFFSVISRGSQFKVESIMLRIAKPENFVLITPSRAQVGQQNAAEALPLIMEPQSAFFKGPLVVLDFQSLYPSIMIAYNICYSTCLGRVSAFKGTSKFGVTDYTVPKGLLSMLDGQYNISANGLLFVKPHVRKSLLAKMLSEILDTRVMVKGSMKGTKSDKAFQRIQNARQLSLKLLANVTYGYTSASFSGRMPCVEIADAIVQYGRETLEKAMDLINGSKKWGAQVVYGDTDSLFVYLPGRTKEDAFRIGYEIADRVTEMNPAPVKLKFEKVYLPSVLLAKKRYVGFKYESLDELEPGFDAKGIETVRRDGHPAVQRILEACIRILFRTRDLSAVKTYCQRQFSKILSGRVSAQDFIFAKEVRLGSYSDKVAPPPGAAVASRRMLADARTEPQYGERVPYLISQGEPGAKLNAQAVSPLALLDNPHLTLNASYYITRTIIPPLARVFNLLGADVAAWFNEVPRFTRTGGSAGPLTGHYKRDACLVCSARSNTPLCPDCNANPTAAVHSVLATCNVAQHTRDAVHRVCVNCAQMPDPPCVSIDCPILFSKVKAQRELDEAGAVVERVLAEFGEEE